MKRLGFPLLAIAALAAWHLLTSPQDDGRSRLDQWGLAAESVEAGESQSAQVERAFEQRQSGVMLTAAGSVARLLSDDREGSRHQRFIVRLPSGHTVLIAHNIDIAPRVDGIGVGDAVRVHGQYEWNDKGGVIHWTHHDPDGSHEAGWIEHDGRRYD